jgi:type VI protein secretion system component Hcp
MMPASSSIYLKFTNYPGSSLAIKGNVAAKGYEGSVQASALTWSVEQTLNIGSQSSGAGAGKVTFNDLTFTKNLDATTPIFFQALCAGTPFQFVDIFFATGGSTAASCRLKLAAVKSIEGSAGVNVPSEAIALEYGGAIWTVGTVNAGWNRVKNTLDTSPTTIIN